MTDRELVDAFEACTLPPDEFHHREHVRVAWTYLASMPLMDALQRFTTSLRRFATAAGSPQRYHETITWAYLLLVHERIERHGGTDWESFSKANPDLLSWSPSVLDRYYRAETLASDLAKRVFVMPDRC